MIHDNGRGAGILLSRFFPDIIEKCYANNFQAKKVVESFLSFRDRFKAENNSGEQFFQASKEKKIRTTKSIVKAQRRSSGTRKHNIVYRRVYIFMRVF